MKGTDIKFVVGQILLIGGIAIISIAGQRLFFIGLALIMVASFWGLHSSWSKKRVGWSFRELLWIACVGFLAWLSAFGKEPRVYSSALAITQRNARQKLTLVEI